MPAWPGLWAMLEINECKVNTRDLGKTFFFPSVYLREGTNGIWRSVPSELLQIRIVLSEAVEPFSFDKYVHQVVTEKN